MEPTERVDTGDLGAISALLNDPTVDANTYDLDFGYTAIHQALSRGHTEAVQL